jgi:translation elongation factor EF-Tu-like GTPase
MKDWVRIRARIDFLRTEDGGRSTPLAGGTRYRPNHNLFEPENREMAMGEIVAPPGAIIRPGDSLELEMALGPGCFAVEIVPGRRWRIQEGAKLVATGTVLALVPAAR